MVGEEAAEVSDGTDWPTSQYSVRALLSYASICTGRFERAVEEAGHMVCGDSNPHYVACGEAYRAEALARQGKPGATDAINLAISLESALGYAFFVASNDAGRGRILVWQVSRKTATRSWRQRPPSWSPSGSPPCASKTALFSPRSPSGGVTSSRGGSTSTHQAGGCQEQLNQQEPRSWGLRPA